PMEHLSRGMQQKIALARALLTSPILMLLDEPTTGLDPRSKKDVQRFIRGIREEHDSSILLCTHDMDEAEELCDRVGILVDGKLLSLEEPEKLKRRYAENGKVPTLEETFMAATGYSVEEAKVEE
ncbi:MAG: ATP-binding cassette domain-containing protein, partial [Rubrobacteraceae bacterium]